MRTIIARPGAAVITPMSEQRCPTCKGSFESCRCGIPPRLASVPTVRAGLYEDMTEDDDRRGPERDETDTYSRTAAMVAPGQPPLPRREPGKPYSPAEFSQLLRHLVADGDRRAARAGRRAARTLHDMRLRMADTPPPPPPLPVRKPADTIPPLVRRDAVAGADDAFLVGAGGLREAAR
ncbi:hypothetical protein [Streptomyces sp. NPDC093109]|uniref:hypothetical protein n=1 Tax=Streptomyces sp. NPDC093109 TaxID=3154977 RepID=UPI00344E6F1F